MDNVPIVNLVKNDELKTDAAKELFAQMESTVGAVPKWMRVMANSEDLLVNFFHLFKVTMDDEPVESHLKWKMALVVSNLNKCEYCVGVAGLKLKAMGLSDEDLDTLSDNLSEREQLAVDYAEAATTHAYNIDKELLQKVKNEFSDAELVEITSVIGLFNFINRFNDSLGVLPEVS